MSAIGAVLVPLLPAAASSAAAPSGTPCTGIPNILARQGIQATAQVVPDAAQAPAHCQVDLLAERAINVRVVLPLNTGDGGSGGALSGAWNGRLMNTGNGGYAGSIIEPFLWMPLQHGEVGSATDTGHSPAWCNAINPRTGQPNSQPDCGGIGGGFVLDPQNNLIDDQMKDFSYRSIEAQTQWGLALSRLYYGKPPVHNYWVGASLGGRQGWEMAQRYGNRYDGYVVGMPAMNSNRIVIGAAWPAVVVNQLLGATGLSPEKSDAANAAAVQACDGIDGTVDGAIAEPRRCDFDATRVPGLSAAEAQAMNLIWDGPRDRDGNRLWGGVTRGTSLATLLPGGNTMTPLADDFLRYWLYQDPQYDWHGHLTIENYQEAFELSYAKFQDTFSTDSTDLSNLRRSGAKVVFWHGTGDDLLTPFSSYNYQQRLFDRYGVAGTRSFVRTFYFPAVAHTYPVLEGNGTGQDVMYDAMIDWVENGNAPEALNQVTDTGGTRLICAYPDTPQSDGTCRTQKKVPADLAAESRSTHD